MNLIECFAPSLIGRCEKTALLFADRTYSFGDLDRASNQVAHTLMNHFGLQKGDRISMFLGNCPELIIYYLAGLKSGCIIVPMNVLYKDSELNHLITDSEPKIILSDRERYEVLQPLLTDLSTKSKVVLIDKTHKEDTLSWDDLFTSNNQDTFNSSHITGDSPALMIYTSGTTGTSKGALLTHHNLVSNITSLLHCWQWTEQDRFILSLPLFHLHGLGNGVHGWLASGCQTRLFERFKAEPILDSISKEKATLFFGVPTMYERFLEAIETKTAEVPNTIRLFVSGSAALSPETFEKFETIFGSKILERYGMSETAMITSNLYTGPNSRAQGTVGRPLPGVSLRIADSNGLPVKEGDIGEIQIKGPNVLKEYWRQPEKTADAYTHDLWFKTGDLGRCEKDGNITITGRAKELIISGGFNIYPQEIINCLVKHPAVNEAAVIGVPDQRRGELVKAYVVTEYLVDSEEIISHCKKHLASFKVPRSIVDLPSLPRNSMGKLQLKKLPNCKAL
jgi:malonyl-CoA/methylmalonyl-CoA synthetase